MPGRPNKKWLETMIQKHGSREAVTALMKMNGAIGGSRPTTGGFFADRDLARRAGRIGGLKSRRTRRQPV